MSEHKEKITLKCRNILIFIGIFLVAAVLAVSHSIYAESSPALVVKGLPEHNSYVSSLEKLSFDVASGKTIEDKSISVKIKNESTPSGNIFEEKDLSIGDSIDLSKKIKKDGNYTITINAVELNEGSGSENNPPEVKRVPIEIKSTFFYDTIDPELSISGLEDKSIVNSDVTLRVAFKDNTKIDFEKSKLVLSSKENTKTLDVENKDTFTVKEEGEYELIATVVDKAGNTLKKTMTFVIDRTEPEITTDVNDGFISSLAKISAKAKDSNFLKGEMTISYMDPDKSKVIKITSDANGDFDVSKEDVNYNGIWEIRIIAEDKAKNRAVKSIQVIRDNIAPQITINGIKDGAFVNKDVNIEAVIDEEHPDSSKMAIKLDGNKLDGETLSRTLTKEGLYEVIISSVDKSGNESKKELSFTIDKTPPITSIKGNENEEHYRMPGEVTAYSNEDAKVYLSVEVDGKTVVSGKEGDNIVKFHSFSKDGDWKVNAYSIDKAGNKGEIKTLGFVKDSKAPVLSIKGATAGSYNNTAKKISVSCNERYFKTNKVTISMYRERKGSKYNVPFKFKSSNTNSVSSLTVRQTGTYHITVSAVDKAGNEAKSKSLTFIVDTEKPILKINIGKTENGYNDNVAPSVTIQDDYMKNKSISLIKTAGNQTGVSNLPFSEKFSLTGGSRRYSNFAKIKNNDGIYTLKAITTDRAGNSAQVEQTFYVNRFGSVFNIKNRPDSKYMKSLKKDLIIEETNISKINDFEVNISNDNKMTNPTNIKRTKKGFTTTYVIPKNCFEEDGIYKVNLVTHDNAGNTSESKNSENGDIWFAIDNTGPIVNYSGLENNKIYRSNQVNLFVSAKDTISKVDIRVSSDNRPLKLKKEGNKTYALVSKGYNQDIKIIATDEAGNTTEKNIYNVSVSSSPFAILMAHKGLTALGTLGIIGIIVAIVVVRKRKNLEEDDLGDDIIL